MDADLSVRKKYEVSFSDIDFTKKLKLSALFNYFQDIGSTAAEELGFGYDAMEKRGVAWVLIRMRVDILRNPELYEAIELETWPQESRKIEHERDYLVRSSSGEIVVRAVSSWVTIDVLERKIKTDGSVKINYPVPPKEKAIDCKLGKIKALSEPVPVYRKTVGYSDVDLNGHINNARYIDFIMDCFSVEEHKKYGVKSIEVNYVNEALSGDVIELTKDVSEAGDGLAYIEGLRSSDGKVIFKAQLIIEKK